MGAVQDGADIILGSLSVLATLADLSTLGLVTSVTTAIQVAFSSGHLIGAFINKDDLIYSYDDNHIYGTSNFASKKEQLDTNGFLNKDIAAGLRDTGLYIGRATPDNYIKCVYTLGQGVDGGDIWYTKFLSSIGLSIVKIDRSVAKKTTQIKTFNYDDVREKVYKPLNLNSNNPYAYILLGSKD